MKHNCKDMLSSLALNSNLRPCIEESLAALTVPFFFLVVSATTFGVFVYYIENIGVKVGQRRVTPC